MKPITRKEHYLAKAAGTYTGPTPPPVLREDYYLATLAGDYSGNCPTPVTRIEKYMSAAAGLTSYVPQPVTRIEKYWYAIAKGTGYVPEPVTREEKFLYAILKNPPKPEYLDKTAEGNPILLTDSAEAPLTALTVYGHSTQDGTPSPENPVPINTAGSSGQVNVSVGGANLLNPELFDPDKELNGITYTKQTDGTIQVSGTATGVSTFYFGQYVGSLKLNETYSFFGTATGMVRSIIVRENGENKYVPKFVMNENVTSVIPYIQFIEGQTINEIDKPMFVMGEVDLPYQPYVTPQTLIIPTPNGLPGIPVSSGGNYTDADGQQWVCDEVDYRRGKYVQRVIKRTFGANEDLRQNGEITDGIIPVQMRFIEIENVPSILGLCDNFSKGVGYVERFNLGYKNLYLWISVKRFDSENPTIEDVKNWLGQNPATVYAPLETPIETPLSAEQIAAYKALHTYSPTTTVSNDVGAWMKVGYKSFQNVGRIYKRNR